MTEAVQSLYDIDAVCRVIERYNFDIVVLQFPDENLPDATQVYAAVKTKIKDSVELYITADSTYGSSVDDVSALHVDCKLLVFFGSDMSVSGSMPVVVCPKKLPLDITNTIAAIHTQISGALLAADREVQVGDVAVAVFLDPAYFPHADELQEAIQEHIAKKLSTSERTIDILFGMRPPCVDLDGWVPGDMGRMRYAETHELIGGMMVRRNVQLSEKDLVVVIGDKNDQIINICLRYSNSKIICYSPTENNCSTKLGVELKEYRERYLGVTRVEHAKVIGLIIGSMGLSGDVIQTTVNRLQTLVRASGKKSYILVMGRLNEAKLRNFPEIDLYCLVSNDDTSLISPKTFHIPVITPYELELGLGAREWNSSYVVGGFVGEAEGGASADEIFAAMLERVELSRPEDAIDISSDEEDQHEEEEAPSSSALVTTNTERRITNQFVSAGADYYKTREFQGMDYSVPEDRREYLDVMPGQSGIAAGYTYIEGEAAAAVSPPAPPGDAVDSA